MKISKQKIKILVNNPEKLAEYFDNGTKGEVVYLLDHFGKLDNDFNSKPLLKLLKNKDEDIRKSAIKNLAKLQDINLLKKLEVISHEDSSSDVRREATSAIGRLRNKKALPSLKKLLKDKNPEVVLQAIRGLLVFKNDEDIIKELKKLKKHSNEIIKDIIDKEVINNGKDSVNKNHTKYPNYMNDVVVHGDVKKTLEYIPNDSIHLTFTSPPYYNARDYSVYQSYDQYLSFLSDVFKEVHRVTKEGRFFVLNTSPIIIPRVGRKYSSKRYPIPYDIHHYLIKMGWEFVDDIIWLKPEASAKNRNAGFLQHRKPLAYKPNVHTESIMVYRKKSNKLIDWNIKQYDEKIIKQSKVSDGYDSGNVWKIDPVFDKKHSAVFPKELCNRVIKYYSYVGDLVFDPFAGSGTLAKAAKDLKRSFFLTELDKEYIHRIREVLGEEVGNFYNLKSFKKKIV